MTNNLRSENLMTQKLSETEKQVSKQNQKILYHSIFTFPLFTIKYVSVSQDSILEMKNPVSITKLT